MREAWEDVGKDFSCAIRKTQKNFRPIPEMKK